MNLLVIEGSGKKETIEKILGKDFVVFATKGHIRDLPKRRLGVDVKNDFSPEYIDLKEQKSTIKKLQDLSKKSKNVYIATDPDREGESIAWHVAFLLNMDPLKKCRVVFNEISKEAIQSALENKRSIDLNLVDAQQARRVLDRLVGYKLSPVLNRKVGSNLSAGRVQSVALKMIVDRERDIQKFKPKEYWEIGARLNKDSGTEFVSELFKHKTKKIKLNNINDVTQVISKVERSNFNIESIENKNVKSNPKPPYTTSTLQQDAYNKLNMTSRKTSFTAQKLYEGININGEKNALVTYIRTDSTRISSSAALKAKQLISRKFGDEYVSKRKASYAKGKSIQDAHEAIRPIDLGHTPESLRSVLSKEEFNLYNLIYKRFLASQMQPAIYNQKTMIIDADEYKFKTTVRTTEFKGHLICFNTESNKDKLQEVPNLSEGDSLKLIKINKEQKFTKPPARYTEASLVKEMEKNGIGRPATYAQTISTLMARDYIKSEKRSLLPSQVAFKVIDLLEEFFERIINVEFTAKMEDKLDKISTSEIDWKQDIIAKFYEWFIKLVDNAIDNAKNVKEKPEETDIKCDKCGSNMLIRNGKFGKFLACSKFPKCRNTKPLDENKRTFGECPICNKGEIVEKKTRKGKIFFGCSDFPECKFATWDEPTGKTCSTCSEGIIVKRKKADKQYNSCTNTSCEEHIK